MSNLKENIVGNERNQIKRDLSMNGRRLLLNKGIYYIYQTQ